VKLLINIQQILERNTIDAIKTIKAAAMATAEP